MSSGTPGWEATLKCWKKPESVGIVGSELKLFTFRLLDPADFFFAILVWNYPIPILPISEVGNIAKKLWPFLAIVKHPFPVLFFILPGMSGEIAGLNEASKVSGPVSKHVYI